MSYNSDTSQEKVCCKTVDILLASPRTTTRRSAVHSSLGSSTFDHHDISVSSHSTPPPFDDYDQFTSPPETTSPPFDGFDYHDTDSTVAPTDDDYLSLKW
jgi:hypothetical protein